jgi:hypothetical protein
VPRRRSGPPERRLCRCGMAGSPLEPALASCRRNPGRFRWRLESSVAWRPVARHRHWSAARPRSCLPRWSSDSGPCAEAAHQQLPEPLCAAPRTRRPPTPPVRVRQPQELPPRFAISPRERAAARRLLRARAAGLCECGALSDYRVLARRIGPAHDEISLISRLPPMASRAGSIAAVASMPTDCCVKRNPGWPDHRDQPVITPPPSVSSVFTAAVAECWGILDWH